MAKAKDSVPEITAITVAGFKSIAQETRIEIAPLTLLAGANSSGKSSTMQPLLLLKQTLEATYDPGALLLSDSHVRFTDASQALAITGKKRTDVFRVGVELDSGFWFTEDFRQNSHKGFDPVRCVFATPRGEIELLPGLEGAELERRLVAAGVDPKRAQRAPFKVGQVRSFLEIQGEFDGQTFAIGWDETIPSARSFVQALGWVIHIPGLRGNPERAYPVTATGPRFIGPFPIYSASVILDWQERGDIRLKTLSSQLSQLGLTWKVEARRVDATSVELRVGRLPVLKRGGATDLVNVADVGIGVSQTLPVLVALLAAEHGQLVYLEQPEIHLHPRAQIVLAEILMEAARRGVKVVAETHSSLLLISVQALVAEGRISPDLVKLHWFQRSDDGLTTVSSANLDEAGAFGDWPEDFGEVELKAQGRYLDAAEARDLGSAPRARKAKAARR
ncbi:MAG TPA: AAA family ATPase [Thermoanaerobaculia bacterium]|nr:AAA family ATPase [Thermoanaerobaculia bacterium]